MSTVAAQRRTSAGRACSTSDLAVIRLSRERSSPSADHVIPGGARIFPKMAGISIEVGNVVPSNRLGYQPATTEGPSLGAG